MKLKSALTLQEMYDLKPTSNVLTYKDYKIPCTCNFIGEILVIECRMALYRPFLEELEKQENIDIENLKFYVSEYEYNSHVGEVVKLKFNLISKEPIKVNYINLQDMIFKGVRRYEKGMWKFSTCHTN